MQPRCTLYGEVTGMENAVENGWWVSTRREEDAQRHLELLQRRHQNFSPGSVIMVLVGFLVAIAFVAALSGVGYVAALALGGALLAIVAVRMVAQSRFGR